MSRAASPDMGQRIGECLALLGQHFEALRETDPRAAEYFAQQLHRETDPADGIAWVSLGDVLNAQEETEKWKNSTPQS